jgi:RNA polymerase sigma factor (TIGR02999 family)
MSKGPNPYGEVTRLLRSWQDGEEHVMDDLFPLVYDELRMLAASYLRKERQGHTLQPTALVHEAFVRLVGPESLEVKDRSHFFAIAARAMRRILVDHARRHQAGKRIAPGDKIALDDAPELSRQPDTDVLWVHEALEKLQEINPRQAQLVELRFFGGLSNPEAAHVLGVSQGTVERDWKIARIWLHRRWGGE